MLRLESAQRDQLSNTLSCFQQERAERHVPGAMQDTGDTTAIRTVVCPCFHGA